MIGHHRVKDANSENRTDKKQFGRVQFATSQSSSTFTISDISQSLGVTPAAIAGVTFKV